MFVRSKDVMALWATRALLALAVVASPPARDTEDRDRGDVPGWVMITMMTAIVVIALLVVFRDAVTTAVKNAFNSITG